MYYEAVFRALADRGVRYLVVGGMAVNLHGVPRVTVDLDVMADLTRRNLTLLIETLTGLGYRPRAPVQARDLLRPRLREQWRREKHMIMFTFQHAAHPEQEVDLFVKNPIEFDRAWEKRKTVKAAGVEIPLLSLDHLIVLKKRGRRRQDRSDLLMLSRFRRALSKEGEA